MYTLSRLLGIDCNKKFAINRNGKAVFVCNTKRIAEKCVSYLNGNDTILDDRPDLKVRINRIKER